MPYCHLISYRLSIPDELIEATILRIVRSILRHVFKYDENILFGLVRSDDASLRGAVQVGIHNAADSLPSRQFEEMEAEVGHLFLPTLQRLLVSATSRIDWPAHVIQWKTPDCKSQGHVHALTQRLLRKLSSPFANGNRLTLFDVDGLAVQQIMLGQGLGAASSSVKAVTGQIQQIKRVSKNRHAIVLTPPKGESRTLLISNDADFTSETNQTITAIVRPVRGQYFYQVVSWCKPQRKLF